jgi:hypothetical protein
MEYFSRKTQQQQQHKLELQSDCTLKSEVLHFFVLSSKIWLPLLREGSTG